MSLTFNHQLDSITASSGVLTLGGSGALILPKGATSSRPGSASAGMLRFNTTSNLLEFFDGSSWASPSGGVGSSVSNSVFQTLHGFSIGNFLTLSGTTYILAQANNFANSQVVGVVTAVIDANDFTLTTEGYISGLTGLTAGSVYYLSATTPGAITATAPSAVGQIVKPLVITDSGTTGYFYNMLGTAISSNSGTSITSQVVQTGHGFSVGNFLALNGSSYILAEANNTANAEVIGAVTGVIDVNTFVLTTAGIIIGLSSLVPGDVYFLSPTTPGAITVTNPTTPGQISKPVLVANSATTGYFYNMRGFIVGAAPAASLLVANNLSDVANPSTALTNLGGLKASNNLSDLTNAATALTNLGGLKASNNLSDLTNTTNAKNNLLGTAVTAGTYTQVVVNPNGLVTSGTQGAGRTLISSTPVSGVASFTITSGIGTTYNSYVMECSNLVSTSSGDYLNMRFYQNGSVLSGGSYSGVNGDLKLTSGSAFSIAAATQLPLNEINGGFSSTWLSQGGTDSRSCTITIPKQDTVHQPSASWKFVASNINLVTGVGDYGAAFNPPVSGLFFFVNFGLLSGTFNLYGVN